MSLRNWHPSGQRVTVDMSTNSSRIPSRRQITNVIVASMLGVCFAGWTGVVYQPYLQAFPSVEFSVFALFLGATTTMVGWAITVAQKPGTELFLLFLASVFACSAAVFLFAFPPSRLFLIGGLLAAIISLALMSVLNGPSHQVFVLLWLFMLGLIGSFFYGVIGLGMSAVSMYATLAAVVFLFVLGQAHRVLIQERERQMSS